MAAPTDQELLVIYREALAAIANAQSYTMPNGRSVTRANLAEVTRMIEWLEGRVDAAKHPGDSTGIVLISNY